MKTYFHQSYSPVGELSLRMRAVAPPKRLDFNSPPTLQFGSAAPQLAFKEKSDLLFSSEATASSDATQSSDATASYIPAFASKPVIY